MSKPESKYLEKFNRLTNAPNCYQLNGARIIVELLPKEEVKSKGGLIITAPKEVVQGGVEHMRGLLGVVLLVGQGYYNDSGAPVPMELKPGMVVMLNEFSTRTFSTFPGLNEYSANTIAMSEEGAVQMQWNSLEEYATYISVLNG
jgi:co-chaperonin GroES (HSP10)